MENAGPGCGVTGYGVPGCGKRGVWWKTRGLVENVGSKVENTGNHYFSPKYALSLLIWEGKILLAKLRWISIQHLGLKCVSRSKKANFKSFREKENHWSAKVSCIGFLLETPFGAKFITLLYLHYAYCKLHNSLLKMCGKEFWCVGNSYNSFPPLWGTNIFKTANIDNFNYSGTLLIQLPKVQK